ncbi:MAG: hypothetical protein AAB777_02390 [Patescibacteria group bacterium]
MRLYSVAETDRAHAGYYAEALNLAAEAAQNTETVLVGISGYFHIDHDEGRIT